MPFGPPMAPSGLSAGWSARQGGRPSRSRNSEEPSDVVRNVKNRLTVLAILLVATVGCTQAATGPTIPPTTAPTSGPTARATDLELAMAAATRAPTDPADAVKAAQAMNAFGLDFYRHVATGTGNVVISPASVAIALAMARAGARGATASQMDAVLRSLGSDEHAAWIDALDAALAARTGTFKDADGKDMDVTLRIANAPFAQRDFKLEDPFLEALATRYGAGVRLVDYIGATEAARTTINRWVSEQTEQRIPELLGQGDLDTATRFVLVNAIYLKAAWQTPFEPGLTLPAAFTRLDGSTVQVPTMRGGGRLPYAAGKGWQAVQLPYVGGELAMTIVVPDDLARFERDLGATVLAAIAGALTTHQVELSLPRFGIETRADLATALTALGMPDAFDPTRADFSGITTEQQLYIAKVIHQANIDVDEKGTTAAAATAVMMGATGMPSDNVILHVDRPFLFLIRDLKTGAVVFLGRVTEPASR